MKQDERKALIGKYILLILGSVLILVPLLATLFSSFKPTKDIVDNFFGNGTEAALDIAGSRRAVARVHIAEVPLLVDKNLFIRKVYERGIDRCVPVRVIRHDFTDNICNFGEFAVIIFQKRMQNAPLDRLKAVDEFGNRPVADNITRVLNKIGIEEIFYVCHFPALQTVR